MRPLSSLVLVILIGAKDLLSQLQRYFEVRKVVRPERRDKLVGEKREGKLRALHKGFAKPTILLDGFPGLLAHRSRS